MALILAAFFASLLGEGFLNLWGSVPSGAVHLAAALKKPVVAVYEPQTATLNTQQWAPWQVAHRSIVKDAPAPTLEKIFTALDTLMTDSLAWECSALQSSGEMEALEPPEEEGTGIGGK